MKVKIFESVLIIADDFTGANDTAAKFASLGFSTATTLNRSEAIRLLRKYDVVALDSESRVMTPAKAYRVMSLLGRMIRNSVESVLIYKKIDSTLRGNVVSEIKGLYDAIEPDLIVFAPAFPKQGRTTMNGIQLVEGLPVERTYFGEDIRTPVKTSNLSSYFSSVFDNVYRHVFLEELRTGKIRELDNIKLLSFDAENDDDLRIIVRTLMGVSNSGKIIMWVGSAGLSEHLAYTALIGRRKGKPILLAVGSVNDLTRSQVRIFVNESGAKTIRIRINDLITDYKSEYGRVLKEVTKALRSSSDVVITTSYCPSQISEGKVIASTLHLSMLEFGSLLVNKLGELISGIIRDCGVAKFGGLFVTGGDVATSVVKHLGINVLNVEGEIEPGIPILRCKNMKLVTKAGGFGNMDTLIRMSARLKKE
ncbi:hypothetical protein MUP77_09785 [Candidatus Bathyarchaeota archaeon]|nr:hypothetical protein [Candidatus Bathyarchaeota archaeon]